MNIRLSLFGYEILNLSVGSHAEEGGYFILGGDFESEEEMPTYGFSLENNV
jgi:hypothetical protein